MCVRACDFCLLKTNFRMSSLLYSLYLLFSPFESFLPIKKVSETENQSSSLSLFVDDKLYQIYHLNIWPWMLWDCKKISPMKMKLNFHFILKVYSGTWKGSVKKQLRNYDSSSFLVSLNNERKICLLG